MPCCTSAATNKPAVVLRRDQPVVTTKSPCFARRSCATTLMAALLPPWLVTITSFFTPARATLSPSANQVLSATSVGKVSVPGESICSVEMLTGCSGRRVTGTASGRSSRTRGKYACAIITSVPSGKCGPCCSVAASGRTSIHRSSTETAKSGQWMSVQSRGGKVEFIEQTFNECGGSPDLQDGFVLVTTEVIGTRCFLMLPIMCQNDLRSPT